MSPRSLSALSLLSLFSLSALSLWGLGSGGGLRASPPSSKRNTAMHSKSCRSNLVGTKLHLRNKNWKILKFFVDHNDQHRTDSLEWLFCGPEEGRSERAEAGVCFPTSRRSPPGLDRPLLLQLLKNINVERDMQKKRDIIKKVIAYMTLGIDVSRLFSDMIMVSPAPDSRFASAHPIVCIVHVTGHRDQRHRGEEDGVSVPQQLRAEGAGHCHYVHQHTETRLVMRVA